MILVVLSFGEDVKPLGLIVGALLYGFAANVLYTLGWISELLWSGGDTSRTEPFRKRVFSIGLVLLSHNATIVNF
jgi:hypothetical protein